MNRHSRRQFLLFGLLPVLNALALLARGLNLSTHGTGNTGRSLVVILIGALMSVLCSAISAVKRGRDLGYQPLATALGVVASLILGPVFLILLIYLAFAKASESVAAHASTPADKMGFRWLWAPVLLLVPWIALVVASALP